MGSSFSFVRYYNLSFIQSRNGYCGQKTENGKTVSCFAKTALGCAKKLNFKCREANITIPNPEVGFDASMAHTKRAPVMSESGYYNVSFVQTRNVYNGQKTENRKTVSCVARTALDCAKKLNIKCREANMTIPNPEVGFDVPKFRWKRPPVMGKSGYYNVSRASNKKDYRGYKMENGKVIQCVAKTALSCARKLNFKCREANISIPNATAGFEAPMPKKRKKKRASFKNPKKKSRKKKSTMKRTVEH